MIWRIIIIMFLIFMFVGAAFKMDDVTIEEMENMTTKMSYDNQKYNFSQFSKNENLTFIPRLVYKYADFLMFASIEGAKVGVQFGYDHPKYNFGLAWKLMLVSIFAVLIIPLIYVILFIGYGIYNIVIFIKKTIKKRQQPKKQK